MYNHQLHQKVNAVLKKHKTDIAGKDNDFYIRMLTGASSLHYLFNEIYPDNENMFIRLVELVIKAYRERPDDLVKKNVQKAEQGDWFLSNQVTGMSLYVDRFAGNIKSLGPKLHYLEKLGVNLLHLMPVFESPPGESDGGYAVSDFRRVDKRFGTLNDLKNFRKQLNERGMYLMVDIVLNHTSHKHQWALKAKAGDKTFQDYFYMFGDRFLPDAYEKTMPEVFPESSPGNFTWVPECDKWVMTVFHKYQWDLNYTNPVVFLEMLDTIFFYANLGVDVLRIDAPAFIWKQLGTICMNLPQVHTLLRLIKQCVLIATPGMAILGEAIVEPHEILKYFGTGLYTAKECDFAYNATQMALQWDMLATGDTRVMLASQHELMQKPLGASWITYTRCHDDIGLGYNDDMIRHAGYEPMQHRKFLKDYYSGKFKGSQATGALFSYNPKTGDARISGSLASLCGLEKALKANDRDLIKLAVKKILLMQAHSFFLGGVPMLFYGDEAGYTNDYSYLNDPGKSYDNRWLHRPVIDWNKNKRTGKKGSVEHDIFSGTQKLITIRKNLDLISDRKNLTWLNTHNNQTAAYIRTAENKRFYGIFNFSGIATDFSTGMLTVNGEILSTIQNHWTGEKLQLQPQPENWIIEPYGFYLLGV